MHRGIAGVLSILLCAQAAANCVSLLTEHAWRAPEHIERRNPFFSEKFVALPMAAMQRQALRTLAHAPNVDGPLRKLAQKKLRYFSADPRLREPAAELEWLALNNTQAALEYALTTFRSPDFDVDFLQAIVRHLASSPQSDADTLALLLPIARGVELPIRGHARLANEAIKAIAERLNTSYPKRWPAQTQRRTNPLEILLHEPIAKVDDFRGGVNKKYLVTFENGAQAIFKPTSGELYYDDPQRPTDVILFNREVSAFDIVHSWLSPNNPRAVFVPATAEVVLTFDGVSYGSGSLQFFMEGYTPLQQWINKHPDEWRRLQTDPAWLDATAWIRTVDFLLGNYDRFPNSRHTMGNLDNLLISHTHDGFSIALIDNGVGRKTSEGFWIQDCPLREHIPEDLKKAIFSLDFNRFRAEYAQRLPGVGIEDFLARVHAARSRIQHGP